MKSLLDQSGRPVMYLQLERSAYSASQDYSHTLPGHIRVNDPFSEVNS